MSNIKLFIANCIEIPPRRIVGAIALIASLALGCWFVVSLKSALKYADESKLNCAIGEGIVNNSLTYLQISLLEQDPTEPYFNGAMMVNLSNEFGKSPVNVRVIRSASRTFGANISDLSLFYDANAQTLWGKEVEFNMLRTTGTHRDFPLDSAKFDFDLTLSPSGLPIHNVIVRNRNPAFELDCNKFAMSQPAPDKFHISFEVRRSPLVQLTAMVLVGAGLLFLIGIVAFVKAENLATSIASFFFFSLWSIRAIFSSQMKIFPTKLDIGILCLCVLLVVLLGFRLAFKELRP